jgi:hypothetical protein
MDWQPIETAPKVDSLEPILVASRWRDRWLVDMAFFDENDGSWASATNHNGYEHSYLEPELWAHIPTPAAPCSDQTATHIAETTKTAE